MAAASLQIPELKIDRAESALLVAALGDVQKHYPKTVVPEKIIDWVNLAGAASLVYGSRLAAVRVRLANEKKRKLAGDTTVQ